MLTEPGRPSQGRKTSAPRAKGPSAGKRSTANPAGPPMGPSALDGLRTGTDAAPMQLDRNGLEVLSHAECLQLLRGSFVGRVIVTDKALPAAFPVNFTLLDEDVIFLTRPGRKLEVAVAGQVVAFEVDEIDPIDQTGWSVLIQGWASVITDPSDLARARALPLRPWTPGDGLQFVRIRSELVSGRRLVQEPRLGGRFNLAPMDARVELRTFAGCPLCGSEELLPVTDGTVRNFLCNVCAACWRVETGGLCRVEPDGCPGCSFKPECTRAAVRDELLAIIEAGRSRGAEHPVG